MSLMFRWMFILFFKFSLSYIFLIFKFTAGLAFINAPSKSLVLGPVLRCRSRLELQLVRWSRSRIFCWPEPRAGAAFFKAAPAASFWQAKKESLVVVTKHDLRAIYNGKCDLKKTCIIYSLFKSSKWKMLVFGAGAAWSRPNLVGAGVGSGTSDFRSRPKKWRLRNTG